MNIARILTIAAIGGALATTGASAKGLLGVNTVNGSLAYVEVDVPGNTVNLIGANIGVNHAYYTDGQLGVDLLADFQFVHDNEDGFHYEGYSLGGGATVYYHLTETVRPFVGGGLGVQYIDATGGHSDDFFWNVGAGVEWEFATDWTLTPTIRYGEIFDSNADGTTTYELNLAYWITPEWNLAGFVTYSDDNDVRQTVFGVGAAWAY